MATSILTTEAIDQATLLASVRSSGNGGYVTFAGDVRDNCEGDAVTRIDYVAYERLARNELARIAAEAENRWPGTRCAVAHRIGLLEVGETSVYIAVGAPHRAEAFEACRWIIDRLKIDAPIWKREQLSAGGSEWIEGVSRVAAVDADTAHNPPKES